MIGILLGAIVWYLRLRKSADARDRGFVYDKSSAQGNNTSLLTNSKGNREMVGCSLHGLCSVYRKITNFYLWTMQAVV